MFSPNICSIYKLCHTSTNGTNDGWEYGLFTINLTSSTFTENSLCMKVYRFVFGDGDFYSSLPFVPVCGITSVIFPFPRL